MTRIELGDKVKDWVTGLVGIAVARVEHLNGCVNYHLQPQMVKDGKSAALESVDEAQLIVISSKTKNEAKPKKKRKATGGPQKEVITKELVVK